MVAIATATTAIASPAELDPARNSGTGASSDAAIASVVTPRSTRAGADDAAVAPNGSINIPVLQNDTGLEDTPLSVSTTVPSNGSVTVENNNTVTYANSGTAGVDTFTYTVTDNDGDNDIDCADAGCARNKSCR